MWTYRILYSDDRTAVQHQARSTHWICVEEHTFSNTKSSQIQANLELNIKLQWVICQYTIQSSCACTLAGTLTQTVLPLALQLWLWKGGTLPIKQIKGTWNMMVMKKDLIISHVSVKMKWGPNTFKSPLHQDDKSSCHNRCLKWVHNSSSLPMWGADKNSIEKLIW